MNCPLCSKAANEEALECASCGAIFAKLRQRATKTAASPSADAAKEETRLDSRVVRSAILFVVSASLGLGVYIYFRARTAAVPPAPVDGEAPPGVPPHDPDFDD